MWPFRRRLATQLGGHSVTEARMLADVMPRESTRLDERTIDDLELASVFTAIDRTRTITGAQVLWRWLSSPSLDRDVLAARENGIAQVGVASSHVAGALGTSMMGEGHDLPRMLWGEPVRPIRGLSIAAPLAAMVACLVLAYWWHLAFIGAGLVFIANVIFDDWAKLRLAHVSRAVERIDDVLGRAATLARALPQLATPIVADLSVRRQLRRRVVVLRAHDPFGIFDLLRAGLLVHAIVARSCLHLIDAERDRLRRVVMWFGEIDALASIATLRGERAAARVAELVSGPPNLVARHLVHPTIANAIGNDIDLGEPTSGLLVTGSNMSGKSTLLRTIAINAILAQSIHTTFGSWRATPLHVRSVMRVADAPEQGMSTYAVEVAAMRELVDDDRPCLFVIDEPFNGTNPAVRVPIVVAVLDYLAGRGLVVAATHDLDVATRIDRRFARNYFDERDGSFDRTLRNGIAPATNAVEILLRAGYPAAITHRLVT